MAVLTKAISYLPENHNTSSGEKYIFHRQNSSKYIWRGTVVRPASFLPEYFLNKSELEKTRKYKQY
jgi:hypothetical protein